ncbi:unnamed protein product, partial [Urochloa humidicola]
AAVRESEEKPRPLDARPPEHDAAVAAAASALAPKAIPPPLPLPLVADARPPDHAATADGAAASALRPKPSPSVASYSASSLIASSLCRPIVSVGSLRFFSTVAASFEDGFVVFSPSDRIAFGFLS